MRTVLVLGLLLAVLAGLAALNKYQHYRARRDMRIRDSQLRKFCMTPDLRGTKGVKADEQH